MIFTAKADCERVADALSRDDVIEAIVNAPAIYKTLRSTAKDRRRRDKLYVVLGMTHDGVLVYTKGVLRRFEGEEHFYLLVSAKRSVEDP